MNKKFLMLALGASLTLSSCVMKKELVECQTQNKELGKKYMDVKEQLAAANASLAASEARMKSMQEQLNQKSSDMAALQNSLDKSLTNASQNNISIEKLVDQINESNQYIRHLVEVKSKSDSLNMVLTNNLTRSLSREELKEVDVQVLKGVVYISLADNMLYKSDNVPVNASAASMKNIRNNWDLSCLRASSVVQALQNQYGVDPKRLTAGGRGEYNPLVANDTETGKLRNRRTQIIITPKLDQFMDLIDKAPDAE